MITNACLIVRVFGGPPSEKFYKKIMLFGVYFDQIVSIFLYIKLKID